MIWVAAIFSGLYVLQQILPVVLLIRLRRQGRAFAAKRPSAHGVSVLVPVKGPVPFLEENLHAILAQDAAFDIELIVAFQDPNDPDLERVQRLQQSLLQSLASRARRVVILDGCPRLGLNPKNSNLTNAMRAASYDWVYCCDADTEMDPTFLRRADALACGDFTRFVTSISVHEGAKTLGAILETVGTNMEFANYFLLSHLSKRNGAMNGASMFFHRKLLQAAGGFEAYLNTITDDLAMRTALVAAGGRCLLIPNLTRVRLVSQTLTGFWKRQARWQLIVRCFDPVVFYLLAPLNWVGQWLLLAALITGDARLLIMGVGVLLVRVLRSLIFQVGLETPRADWWKSWLLPVYDLLSPCIWLGTITITQVEWAGQLLYVRRDGSLGVPETQT